MSCINVEMQPVSLDVVPLSYLAGNGYTDEKTLRVCEPVTRGPYSLSLLLSHMQTLRGPVCLVTAIVPPAIGIAPTLIHIVL